MSPSQPGLVILLGSGETQASSRKIHAYAAQQLPARPRIAILETPAGFEPNSDEVAGGIKRFLQTTLQNHQPQIQVIAARRRGSDHSPDNPQIVAPLLEADEILLGPGSPTYCVRQLRNSLALDMLRARHWLGATLFLSSSATLAFGALTMPVYEIYKVGEDLHWKTGLDFFAPFGLSLVIIPHWNNNDGGDKVDTSRCYVGQERFQRLRAMLDSGNTLVGIDEHTAAALDFAASRCMVMGKATVTVMREGRRWSFGDGQSFPLELLGDWRVPAEGEGVPAEVWRMAVRRRAELSAEAVRAPRPSEEALQVLEARQQARARQDWAAADVLRQQLLQLGWQVQDTAGGSVLLPLLEES